MNVSGVLYRAGDPPERDPSPVRAENIAFEEGHDYPVTVNFDMRSPIGIARLHRDGDGNIIADMTLSQRPDAEFRVLALGGVMSYQRRRQGDDETMLEPETPNTGTATSVAFVRENVDPDMPEVVFPDE